MYLIKSINNHLCKLMGKKSFIITKSEIGKIKDKYKSIYLIQ
jgi:hypothetical protein